MSAGTPLAELAWQEVVALHAFFVAWFRGDEPAPDFASCENGLAKDFRMINPDGSAHERDDVVRSLRAARGKSPPDFRIEVLDPAAIWTGEGCVLLEYTEQQYRDGRTTRRRSSALFLASPTAPRGLEWRHLHETWMEAA